MVNRRWSILGDFLEFGRLLAADAVAGLERLKVASGAEIAHAKELAIMEGVKPMDFEDAVGLSDTLQANLATLQAPVLHRVEKVRRVSGKRLILIAHFQNGAVALGDEKLAFNYSQRFCLAGQQGNCETAGY
jgi:hypothetical protein